MHSVQVAAELERGSLQWRAVRELALDRERWAVEVANERGGTSRRLPDLVAWPSQSRRPVAVVLEPGQRNERRQHAALEGWQAAIREGRYAQVRYKTDPVTARQLERLAAPLGLTAPAFLAVERLTADTLVAPPAAVKPDTTTTAAQTPPAPVSVPPPPPPAPEPRSAPPSASGARRHTPAHRWPSAHRRRGTPRAARYS